MTATIKQGEDGWQIVDDVTGSVVHTEPYMTAAIAWAMNNGYTNLNQEY